MDIYPIMYKNLTFNITIEKGISFTEIRSLLDYLMEENAFKSDMCSNYDGPEIYEVYLNNYYYVVDVFNCDVIIYKKENKTIVSEN